MPHRHIITGEIRQQIRDFLRDALSNSIDAYHAYLRGTMDAAQRSEYEKNLKAGKAALDHIETLLELAEFANLPDGEQGGELARLLAQASIEADRFRAESRDE